MPLSQENKLIELKYASKQFGKMSQEERRLSAFKVLITIHAITGWTVPVSELMDILVNQFELKLAESYSNVNEQEVEYAFRNRGVDIKDWGKALNLSLIDEIMIPYLESRFELSRVEEQLNKPKMIEQPKELTDEEKADWICDWKSMPEINIELIPLMFYEFLDSKKIINLTKKEKWQYTEKATIAVKIKLMEALPLCKTTDSLRELQEFERQQANGFEKEFKGRILNRAKRQIVFDYLKDKLNESCPDGTNKET